MKTNSIMIQGTASAVGKSVITAGLCRIFKQDGYTVAPFKSQNMALNSYVTNEGLEMGRAQAVQAEACGIEPSVLMNPILIKPTKDMMAQVVVNGKVLKNLSARDYGSYKTEARRIVKDAYEKLAGMYDLVVLEGAGSPAEINLKDDDLVNMGMAEIADSPVVLVADIDKGGVFASIVGTLFLLTENERKRVKGVIINKFRGEVELLQPGLRQLEEIIKIPVIGVVPYADIAVEDEDSVTERFSESKTSGDLNVVVIQLPYMSNFTDFDVFTLFEDVNLVFADKVSQVREADVVVLPGTKNTIEDLKYIKDRGFDKEIVKAAKAGTVVMGICGGFQMLGKRIKDPHAVESSTLQVGGIGLLDVTTVMAKEKTTRQVSGKVTGENNLLQNIEVETVNGYEIHMGMTHGKDMEYPFIKTKENDLGIAKNNIFGTYLHGIFDNTGFTRLFLNNIRIKKGLEPVAFTPSYAQSKEAAFNNLADLLRRHLDIDLIYKIVSS